MSIIIRKNQLALLLFLSGVFNNALADENNLAKYRIVFHSSSVDVNQCGHLVVDGSLSTYWESKPGNPQWLTIDLGTEQEINNIVIQWGTNFATEFKTTFLRDANDKGTQISLIDNNKEDVSEIKCSNQKARIIRFDIIVVKDSARGCIIKEFQVLGAAKDRFVSSAPVSLPLNNLSLNGSFWRLQNSMFVSEIPKAIAANNFNDKDWIPARVPGTIMGSYYNFGALPDPFYSDNMHQISDEFFSGNDFWYRLSVTLPKQQPGKRLFLNFKGINWKADVYFNSRFLGRIDGAYQRAEFEVTKLINGGGANTLAVLIHHTDNWKSGEKKVTRKYIGAPTRNGDNLGLDSPTILASAGWNWLPIIRGRNTGIWQDVYFQVKENVTINDPWVSSILLLPDTTKADLTIRTELRNHSTEVVEGKLVAKFGNSVIEYPVKLSANEVKTVTLDKTAYSQLALKNPRLWWPNGYGAQNLHKLSLQFIVMGKISDSKEITFGIRQVDTKVSNNILFVYCNGQRILLRGGNWGLPEGMIRCDSTGYDLRVKLHKNANFNMIRNWVGMTGDEDFYEACDRYGLMIWDDFWLANPVDGPDPKDTTMFMNNVRDKIKWVRKHPSLALYCGRNEGFPPPELDNAMNRETRLLDGTRHYIPHSSEGTVTGLGPYDIREPAWYFANRGITLHSELGIVAFPEVESMHRMMDPKDLWPINDMWAYHDYQWGRSEKFTARIEERFGKPTGVEDYCRRAQLLNYESARAMFEALQSNQGSGVLLWMSQAAWPSMICQIYDHYFEYTSAFFAVKKACQQVHILWDILKNDIRIANNTSSDLKQATAKATVYDANGRVLWEKSASADVLQGSAKSFFMLEKKPGDEVSFLKLELLVKGKIVDDNFYWLENKSGNCLDLNDLPKAKVSITSTGISKNRIYTGRIVIRNTSSNVTLLNRIKFKDKKSGESILPVFFSDDYINLLPNEEKVITFNVELKNFKASLSEIYLEGWNTERVKVDLITN